MMSEQQERILTSDEKVMAGLSHLLGLIPALIFWAVKKNESKYVEHQALQAVFFAAVMFVAAILLMLISFFLMFGFIFLMIGVMVAIAVASDPETLAFVFPIFTIFFGVFPSFSLLYLLVLIPLRIISIIAAIKSFMGQPWRYPFVAKWVDRIIANQQKQEMI